MTSREIDIFDNPFRDPVYEEMGFMFDSDRNQYYEIVQDPRLGEFRRYLSPRDQSTPPELSDARIRSDMIDLMKQGASNRRVGAVTDREAQAMLMGQMKGSKGLVKGRRFQAGGAVNDVDIFEEELRSMANEPFTMPAQPIDEKSGPNPFGYGYEMKQTGTPGVDQVFTQILFSPEIRAVTRVEDLPPRTLQQAKDTFEYLTKMQGIDKAAEHLLKTFGRVSINEDTFPILRSIGLDPREQKVTTMTKVRMQTSGEDMFDDRFSKPIQDARQEESRLRDMINRGVGSLMQ